MDRRWAFTLSLFHNEQSHYICIGTQDCTLIIITLWLTELCARAKWSILLLSGACDCTAGTLCFLLVDRRIQRSTIHTPTHTHMTTYEWTADNRSLNTKTEINNASNGLKVMRHLVFDAIRFILCSFKCIWIWCVSLVHSAEDGLGAHAYCLFATRSMCSSSDASCCNSDHLR